MNLLNATAAMGCPLCNLITMVDIKAADARLGTNRWDSLADPLLEALVREGMRDDGSFIAFRSR